VKIYLIWANSKGEYISSIFPHEQPDEYPICFKSWKSAEKWLMNYMEKNYEFIETHKLEDRREYIFQKKADISWRQYKEKYIIIERPIE